MTYVVTELCIKCKYMDSEVPFLSNHLCMAALSKVWKTLKVSLETSIKLSKILIPHKNPLISESGFSNPKDLKFIIEKANIQNFLIGESLLKSENIGSKLSELSQITL